MPRLIVLHYTAMPTAEAALDRLCDPEAEVSAHYLVTRTGEILSLVPEEARAWHAGAGCWGGCRDVNSASIGIELDNDGMGPFAEPLMAGLEGLLDEVMARWAIPPEGVIGHSDMAPGRKSDPGPHFDWARLAHGGRAVHVGAPEDKAKDEAEGGAGAGPDLAGFAANLARFGYDAEVGIETLLPAFRLRFRPGAAGPLDASDRAIAAGLARAFPVDPRLARP